MLLFTSGTAGEPKAAMLTHGNLTANLRQMLAIPARSCGPTTSASWRVPLFHVFGLNVALGLVAGHGGRAGARHRFDAVDHAATIGP